MANVKSDKNDADAPDSAADGSSVDNSTAVDALATNDTPAEQVDNPTAQELAGIQAEGAPVDLPSPEGRNDADTDVVQDVGLGAERKIFPGGEHDLAGSGDGPHVVVSGVSADERNRTYGVDGISDNDKRYQTDSSGAFR